ncbi:energy-coupling factor transporter transmembrane component T [Pullulanibacillus sp. KACC 23026]|uniref:energy-coupling factor transporter transmembrane component T family protein n=1 Tax=Pullulanibacillus sp. KACC 23026 TaxID=3028315 RepID=UPI0023AEAA3F|nr:energy-coupling factor transporter transmembrane component T [Pullulanibacillus sp. KACC 23026]WEG12642.1 energy-coupling factor transporter transmembrane component T [Pullulanibacillus sp. KACC 23026]
MFNVIIGQYYPGKSPIHKMDPRSKLLAVLLFVIIIFLANNWLAYGMVALYCLLALSFAQVPLRYIYKGLKPVILIILFTLILNLLFTQQGKVIFEWRWFQLTTGGIRQSIFISVRLLAIVLMTTLLTLTTTPIEITDGLETLLAPFKKLKFPVHEFALMMSISLRFIPTLMEETEKIMKAQSARGAEFTSGSFIQRVKAIIPLLVPLFVSAFKRAEELAMAMEARGYRGDVGRTKLRALVWEKRDHLLMISMILFTGVLCALHWFSL